MKMNNQNFMTISILIISGLMILSSSNWIFSWVMMEIMTMTFIPMMTQSNKMSYQMMKFFLIQSVSSSLIIMTLFSQIISFNKFNDTILCLSFMLKLGFAPFHYWLPMMFSFMNMYSCLAMSTIQKFGPMIIISQIFKLKMMNLFISMSLLIGTLSSMKQNKFKKLMSFISISSMPWMLISIYMSKMYFIKFMIFYTLINSILFKIALENNLININQFWSKSFSTKLLINLSMLSVMGIPPLLGFLPKWMIIKESTLFSTLIPMMMILSSCFQALSFMKMSISNLFMSSSMKKYASKNKLNFMNFMMLSINTLYMTMLSNISI